MANTPGGIMSLFSNMFSANNPAPAQPAQPTTTPTPPGNIPQGAQPTGATNSGTAPNGAVPPNTAAPAEDANKTPLDQFDKLWENPTVDPNAPQKPTGVFGEVDPKKFMEAAGKIDFTKVLTPELVSRVQAGGEDGTRALLEALNSSSRAVYAQSAFAATKIVEQALNKAKENFVAELPQHIKRQTVSENLRNENPIFSHPATSPILSAIESQLQVKFPNASASELADKAKTYLEAFATAVTPQKAESTSKTKGSKDVDWDDFFNS